MQKQPLAPSENWQLLKDRQWTLPLLEGEPMKTEPLQEKTFQLEKNPLGWSQLHFVADSLIEITDTAKRTGLIELGYQRWKTSKVGLYPLYAR